MTSFLIPHINHQLDEKCIPVYLMHWMILLNCSQTYVLKPANGNLCDLNFVPQICVTPWNTSWHILVFTKKLVKRCRQYSLKVQKSLLPAPQCNDIVKAVTVSMERCIISPSCFSIEFASWYLWGSIRCQQEKKIVSDLLAWNHSEKGIPNICHHGNKIAVRFLHSLVVGKIQGSCWQICLSIDFQMFCRLPHTVINSFPVW